MPADPHQTFIVAPLGLLPRCDGKCASLLLHVARGSPVPLQAREGIRIYHAAGRYAMT